MPLKFSKETSTHLFKYIKTIDIKFNPFDGRSTSARELIRQVRTPRYIAANPKLNIQIDVHNTPAAPKALFQFIDDSEQVFDTQKFNCNEMLFDVHLKGMQLDAEYEMSGKSIDDH